MCGIVGYVGDEQALPVLLDGMKKLEYRGYDSAGVAVIGQTSAHLIVERKAGRIGELLDELDGTTIEGRIGIGHTRWATHGAPTDGNAHPHRDCTGGIAVVHNGIIENHLALRSELEARGRRFSSETDTEVFAHLIDQAVADGAASQVIVSTGRATSRPARSVMVKVAARTSATSPSSRKTIRRV